jgi:hypothetical protein
MRLLCGSALSSAAMRLQGSSFPCVCVRFKLNQVFEQLVATVGGFPLLQIDGQPMSGTEATHTSLPAIEGALQVLQQYRPAYPVTISGGINLHTPALVQQYMGQGFSATAIWGVGVGTIARTKVAGLSPAIASHTATSFVNAFVVG